MSSDDSLTPTPTVIYRGKLEDMENRDWRDSSTPIPPVPRRSSDSVVIVLLGKSGVGRSSVFNNLFNDPTFCPVSSSDASFQPRVTTKLLMIPEEDGPKSTHLNVIHLHSSLVGYYSAAHFMQTFPIFSVCSSIIPNLVLFVINAADTSSLRTLPLELRGLNKLNIIDNNLIVVVTHSEVLGSTETEFKVNTGRLEIYLQQQISQNLNHSTLLLSPSVRVVFVENYPESLQNSGDFHVFPNGELTPLNLFVAIMELLEDAEDNLGSLFIRWYFKSTCPDKKFKPKTEQYSFLNDNTPTKDGQMLPDFAQDCFATNSQLFQSSSLQHEQIPLGFGFCPISGTTRICLTNPLANEEYLLSHKMFKFPGEANVTLTSKNIIMTRVFTDPSEENLIQCAAYGIPLHANLFFKETYPKKAYTYPGPENVDSTFFTLMNMEVIVAEFTLEDPKSSVFNPVFLKLLSNLPDKYDKMSSTTRHFVQFFSFFGTHIVTKVPLGGFLSVRSIVDATQFPSYTESQIEKELEAMLQWYLVQNTKTTEVITDETLSSLGIVSFGTIRCNGGDSLSLLSKHVTDLTSDSIYKWQASVETSPSALWNRVSLFPFYELVDSHTDFARYTALKEATMDYLKGTLNSTTGLDPVRNKTLVGFKSISPPASTSSSSAVLLRLRKELETCNEPSSRQSQSPFSIVNTPSPELEAVGHVSSSDAEGYNYVRRHRRQRRMTSSAHLLSRRFGPLRLCCCVIT